MPSQRAYIVGGNWKSNPGTIAKGEQLIEDWSKEANFESQLSNTNFDTVLFPTFLHASKIQSKVQSVVKGGNNFSVGIQNSSKEGEGAFTGEVTSGMIADAGFKWVLIGHSERREKYNESNADLSQKFQKAISSNLNVIFCIGEKLDERESNSTYKVLKQQLEEGCIPQIKSSYTPDTIKNLVLAYEPVWAIGTGKVATVEQAQESHKWVREIIKDNCGEEIAGKIRIQYGGSVSKDNCKELIGCEDVDGFLVGGASLKPDFMTICNVVSQASA